MVSFCFSIIRRSPTSTLFPYTTLFRSGDHMGDYFDALKALVDAGVPVMTAGQSDLMRGSLDRKSTRLNSSHLGISYAVFCLKKKKDVHSNVPCTLVTDGKGLVDTTVTP